MRNLVIAMAMLLAAILPLGAKKKTTHTVMSANVRITGLPMNGRASAGMTGRTSAGMSSSPASRTSSACRR